MKGVIRGEDAYDKSQMLEHQIIADVRYRGADSCAPLNEEYTDWFITFDECERMNAAAIW